MKLGFALACVALAAMAGLARADETADRLKRAVELAQAGQMDAAWSDARSLPSRADDLPDLEALADAFAGRDRCAEALALYARCADLEPKREAIRGAIEQTLRRSPLPAWLAQATLAHLPVATHAITEGGSPLGLAVRPADFVPPPTATDPRYADRYSLGWWFYVENGSSLKQAMVVHVEDGEDLALALRLGSAALRLDVLARQRLGLRPRFTNGGVPQLWVSRTGRAGAEQWKDNLYFYDVGRARSAQEWLREVAHEWGHLVIPGFGGYRQPEPWINGPIGEALFLGWLPGANWGVDFASAPSAAPDADYQQFANDPQNPALLSGTSLAAAQYAIGLVTAVEQVYGFKVLRRTLAGMGDGAAAGFLHSLRRVLAGAPSQQAAATAPGRFLVYVPQLGVWQFHPTELFVNGRTVGPEGIWRGGPGWIRVRALAEAAGPLELVRQDPPGKAERR